MNLNLFPLTVTKLKKFSIIITVFFFLAGYLFVTTTLNEDEVKVQEKQSKNKDVIEEKPVKVTLILNGNPYFTTQTFRKKLKNTNTILDLLEDLRKDKMLTYERTFYINSIKLDSINGFTPKTNESWIMFMSVENQKSIDDLKNNVGIKSKYETLYKSALVESTDITNEMGNINLVNNATYEIKIIRTAEPQ